jgi:hypothetical protein
MQFFNLKFRGDRNQQPPINPLKAIRDQIRSELQSLVFKLKHKNLVFCCVINTAGVIVSTAQQSTREALQSDMIHALVSLRIVSKQASLMFGFRTGCTQLKIFGDHRVFSMYSLDDRHILVFFYKIGVEERCSPTDPHYKEEVSESIAAMADTVRASVTTIKALLEEIDSSNALIGKT